MSGGWVRAARGGGRVGVTGVWCVWVGGWGGGGVGYLRRHGGALLQDVIFDL